MAAPEKSKVDPYGFERPTDFDFETYQEFMSRYLQVLARRARKWQLHLLPIEGVNRNSRKTKRYVRKGIPNSERASVWMLISGAQEEMCAASPSYYQDLVGREVEGNVAESIHLDLHRTFPDNIYFVDTPDGNRQPLLRVLSAFANHNPHIGYCQGLNFITGILLLIVKNEEKVFWLLNVLANRILPTDYFTPDMTGLKVDQEVLGELIRIKCPALHQMLESNGITYALFTTKWFVCAYIDILPIDTVLRILDCLFYEGSKILFRVGVTLIKSHETEFMKCERFPDIVNMFKAITTDSNNTDCHHFMQRIFSTPGSFPMATIDKLRLECRQRMKL